MFYRHSPDRKDDENAINDVFDILNGRFPKEGLSKSAWESNKKAKLQTFLHVLNLSEEIARDPNRDNDKLPDQMFMSDTTLMAWRLVMHSSIGLIDELFSKGYTSVLTGRFNQDPIEVLLQYLKFMIIILNYIYQIEFLRHCSFNRWPPNSSFVAAHL